MYVCIIRNSINSFGFGSHMKNISPANIHTLIHTRNYYYLTDDDDDDYYLP